MKPSTFLKGIVFLFVVIFLGYSYFNSTSEEDTQKYITEISSEREKKNIEFKNDSSSPLTEDEKSSFNKLNYFPVDANYKVNASLDWYGLPKTVKIKTTKGLPRNYKKVALAKFHLNGESLELTLLADATRNPLTKDVVMILFTDQTSGKVTYGAGRYIELHNVKKGQLQTTIDFNTAYNPYCAYNENFDCPIPPSENYLATEVKVGEKNFKKH
ncbi:DUF1684 domain-containing protein [Flammeovirga kamogawensis]|uniref:DUF1684 domain-containing protein n=1 Tax=Flammeovirga kamogawensis TaxID=373891 RepID=A0ABX8GVI9_9BACT|nr:DUF1684 domain-containing protein [Flammeovirga kamogawensis]MBB6461035.1 hypothetical protein [Flammeovirga kamogawensis]QWG07605.1 DUF1684 domain-containing protein [Flammeovirga kamogawensis]TRX69416.1 DUF1684 domain-containing protein [Flammeovirga kamogawensis]